MISSADRAVVYSVDSNDIVRDVNDGWTSFARANGADFLEPDHVIGRPLWDFVSDSTTVQLYRELLRGVRSFGSTASFPIRCDAPDTVRILHMEMGTTDGSTVLFRVTPVSEEKRSPVSLLASGPVHDGPMIRMCGWCKRVLLPDERWVEADEALRTLAPFATESTPEISHGICGECHAAMDEEISRISAPSGAA
jgi:hypothetical protein